MTKIYQIIIYLLIASAIYAQDSVLIQKKKHQIIISTGLSKHIIQDDVISPLIYKGVKAPIWIKYKHFGAKFNHNFYAYFNQLELKSDITNRDSYFSHYTDNINGYLSYSVNRKIHSTSKYGTDIFIGGKFKSYINYRNHYYTINGQAISGEQSTSIDFILSLNKRYNSNDDLITFNLNYPIISYVLMSGMFNANVSPQISEVDTDKNLIAQFFKNGDFVSLNRQFEIQSELSIYKSLSNSIAFGLSYYFHFYSFEKHPDLNRIKYTNNHLLLELLIKL